MLASVTAALLLMAAAQAPSDRARAEQLARDGHAADALAVFTRILEGNPSDAEVRLWIARLDLRLGRVDKAEAGFRAVLASHPGDLDARIGLAAALTRRGAWRESLTLLQDAERGAGENGDLFAALARAYRHAGDDPRALEYFQRAHALSPKDPDITDGLEGVIQTYGHTLTIGGFSERPTIGSTAESGAVAFRLRVTPQLFLQGSARVEKEAGVADALFGGGATWRAGRRTLVGFLAKGGPDNTALPSRDVSGQVLHYEGAFELGASLRTLSFTDAEIISLSPVFSWDGGRWRLSSRYSYSRSRFDATGEVSGDHSVALSDTWRGWRRVWITTGYAYGIEAFEQLTADQLGSLAMTTVSSGIRISTSTLTIVNAAYEHQWRSNDSRVNRFTLSFVQAFP
jgi:YaiO family outer membrane protein